MKRNAEIIIMPIENGFVITSYRMHGEYTIKLAFESKKSLFAYLDEHFTPAKKPTFEGESK